MCQLWHWGPRVGGEAALRPKYLFYVMRRRGLSALAIRGATREIGMGSLMVIIWLSKYHTLVDVAYPNPTPRSLKEGGSHLILAPPRRNKYSYHLFKILHPPLSSPANSGGEGHEK